MFDAAINRLHEKFLLPPRFVDIRPLDSEGLNPDYPDAYFYKGRIYFDREEYRNALLNFNETLQLSPNFADAYYRRGLVYHEMGQTEREITDYEQALKLDPNHSEVKKKLLLLQDE